MAATSAASLPLLQTVQIEHLPSSHQIHIALYRNITNAAFLHQQLLVGNSAFEYALIDASVVSPLPFPFFSL
jgi:EKC/KEOPS complex subunit CGI121/TPRKB